MWRTSGMFWIPKSFPFGLPGLLAEKPAQGGTMLVNHPFTPECGGVKPADFKDHEDRVSWVVNALDADELALLYKQLYNLGYRNDGCAARIAALRKRYKP